jgi:Mce-associated membrane protein
VAGERSRARAPQPATPDTRAALASTATEPTKAPRTKAPTTKAPTTKAPGKLTQTKQAVDRRHWLLPVVALVAALAVLGTVAGISLGDPGGQARTDRAAASQARTSIEQMLSYNYKTIDAQAAQIEGLLTGSFKGEFSSAMDKDIKPLAVKNQTVVQAKVSDIGVMSSSEDTVKVLAFVNQARIGTDQKQPVVDQNRVIATMSKVGDRWLISKVEAF